MRVGTAVRHRVGKRAWVGAVVACLVGGGLVAPAPARAVDCAPPGGQVTEVPWAQQALAPEQVWPFSRGGGVIVAVLGSGVDGEHPQLRGRVEKGFDAAGGSGRADTDCTGTGTAVAGLIAARQADGSPFTGLAPAARILPVRVVDDRAFAGDPVEPAVLARGIKGAVDRGAQVVAVTVAAAADDDALRAAVSRAVAKGVVVVAATGDRGDDGNPVSYPAAYPEVVAVGAIGPEGLRWPASQYGPHLDLVAPGVRITTTQRGGGLTDAAEGTALACGYVAASVALLLAKRGDAPRSELIRLLNATAVPGPGGVEYGHGTVNPYGAVNGHLLPGVDPAPLPAFTAPAPTSDRAWAASRRAAVLGTVLALLVVLAVGVAAVALPRGRRRRWRPAVAAHPPHRPEPAEPGPPVQLFDDAVPDPATR